ncbi:MAG: L,D-transpeptidase family protein [Flavobacteriales bacterium]|nr:L,D-transpeptidase family protein [Flavobacteriales bacterium]
MERTMHCALLLLLPVLVECQAPFEDAGAPGPERIATAALPERPLAFLIDSLELDAGSIRFHVDKSERRFRVYVQDRLLKAYPCVLGEKPVGDKHHQGDRKTPEGTFGFRSKRVHAQWHKFIWVDYPNAESWRRYNERKANGLIPHAKGIGGEIGIHGVPEGMDHWIEAGADWTWGCIALKNADVDEIYPFITVGKTAMEVVP